MSPCPRRQVLAATAGVAAALPLTTAPDAHAAEPADDPAASSGWVPVPDPVPVPLDGLYDNDGIDTASAPGGDFDGSGYTFPGEELPAGRVEVDGVPFLFPAATAGAKNNVVALGRRIELPKGRCLSAVFLTAGSYGNASGKATVHYADGSTGTAGADWYAAGGSLPAPYRYKPDGTRDEHSVGIGTTEVWLDPQREAVAVTLPVTNPAEANKTALHVFALSLQPAAQGRALVLRDARPTHSLLPFTGAQSVEATVVNAGTVAVLAADEMSVRVDVPGARTVEPARVRRLDPGEQARVRVGIRNRTGAAPGTQRDGSVTVAGRGTQVAVQKGGLTLCAEHLHRPGVGHRRRGPRRLPARRPRHRPMGPLPARRRLQARHEYLHGVYANGSARTEHTVRTPVPGDDRSPDRTFTLPATGYGAHMLNTLCEVLTEYGPVDEGSRAALVATQPKTDYLQWWPAETRTAGCTTRCRTAARVPRAHRARTARGPGTRGTRHRLTLVRTGRRRPGPERSARAASCSCRRRYGSGGGGRG